MFTGLVEALGHLQSRDGNRLHFTCPFAGELGIGESVAVNGVCLTVERRDAHGFTVTAVATTLRRTNLGSLQVGGAANLERALPAGGRFGGHIVQGHVDGTGRITARTADGPWTILRIAPPAELLRYIIPRGSVAVDGVSLTVAERRDDAFTVALVPHTEAHTTLGSIAEGAWVNLEADIVAKYVEGLLQGSTGGMYGDVRR